MANSEATGKKAGHGPELIQRTRKAVLSTFDAIDKRGKVISEILADEFEKNPIKFMELASKLMPREIQGKMEHEHKHTHESISATSEWITDMLGADQESETKKPSTH